MFVWFQAFCHNFVPLEPPPPPSPWRIPLLTGNLQSRLITMNPILPTRHKTVIALSAFIMEIKWKKNDKKLWNLCFLWASVHMWITFCMWTSKQIEHFSDQKCHSAFNVSLVITVCGKKNALYKLVCLIWWPGLLSYSVLRTSFTNKAQNLKWK